jgi:S-formylglutathione hydrolase FrmB
MATEKLPSTSIFLFLLFLSLGRMLAQTTSAGDSNVPPTPQTAPAEEETAPAKAKIPLTVAPPIPTPPGAPPVPAGLTATYFDPRIVGYAFRSEVLGKKMAFTIVYPQDYAATGAPWPVLFFLHGLGRNEHTLIDDPSSRQKLLDQPYVIVLPKGENGWYFDSPVDPKRHYAAYLDEVMAQAARVANISAERPERAIGGWSAGGFGSVWACLHHPESFSTLATIIGVVDFPSAGTRFKVPDSIR